MDRVTFVTAGSPRWIAVVLVLSTSLMWLQSPSRPVHAAPAPAALPACRVINTAKDLMTGQPDSIGIIEQAYNCILRHYISGKTVDDRVLLRGAFKEIAQSLPSSLSDLTLPALLGDRSIDWQIFANIYGAIALLLPQTPVVQQALVQLAIFGMVGSLHDGHLSYWPPAQEKTYLAQSNAATPAPTFGIVTSPLTATTTQVFITAVLPGTPAAAAGLQAGDIIQQVGGHAVLAQGQPTAALLSLTTPSIGTGLSLTLQRPSTGAQLTVSLLPRLLVLPSVTARALPGGIAYVRLYDFSAQAANKVFDAIGALHLGTPPRGLVLDLRGNPGGEESQAVRLLSAFVHHATVGYEVPSNGPRIVLHTDNAVPLLHTSLVVLTDGGSASSSELMAAAVRDLHLGLVVGTQTAGDLAAAYFYSLSDGSALEITQFHVLGALGEQVNGIGIRPNQRAVATAADLSAGNDPVLDRAVQDIESGAAGQVPGV